MTVNSSSNKTIVLGDGIETSFAFDFIGVDAAYIDVILTDSSGNETPLAQGAGTTQYAIVLNSPVTGAIWGVGGTVTYNPSGTPIPAGSTLTIFRTLPLTQAISLQRINSLSTLGNGAETGLDTLEMQIQQVFENISRAIIVPIVDPTAPLPLPPIAQRANMGMAFDGAGNPIAGAIPATGVISSAMQPVVDAATLALGRTAFGLGAIATEGIGAGLQDDGAGNVRVNETLVSDSANQNVVAAFHTQRHIATGPISYTLPRANTLWNGFGFWIEVPTGGAVTLVIDSHDKIEGQSSGTSASLAIGSSSFITTDGANTGTWRIDGGFIGISGFMSLVTSGGNGPSLKLGTDAASGDDAALIIARALSPGSGLLNSHAVRDETLATVNVTGAAFSGYAAFDAAFQVQGAAVTPQNHVHGFQARQLWSATGHCQEWAGFTSQPTVTNGAGIIDNAYGFFAFNALIAAGGITNQYAFYANPLSGATNSYFLYQGAPGNPSVLSGNLYIGGRASQLSVEIANIQFNGTAQFGLLFADTNAAAGSGAPIQFYRNNSSVGSISNTLSATAYNTSSDERLKDFTGNYDPKEAIRIIRADPVREFSWKLTKERAVGWGAQTSHAVSHDLATPGNDKAPDEEGFMPWGIDQGKRTPYLWAALTDALDRIEALEARMKAAGIAP